MKLTDNTVQGVRVYIEAKLSPTYSVEEIQSIQTLLFDKYFGMSLADLVLDKNRTFSESEILKVVFAMNKMEEGMPIQYVLGETDFFGRVFQVNKAVLIPRPETEELCDWIISSKPQAPRILDIGTGSGCIPITLQQEIPSSSVTATDIAADALEVARNNGELNSSPVEWLHMDILDKEDPFKADEFHIIVSNPPYVLKSDRFAMEQNVLEYEPHIALFVEDDDPLLFYRIIAQKSLLWLKPGAWLYFEIHEELGDETSQLLEQCGYREVELKEDIFGKPRMVRGMKPSQ